MNVGQLIEALSKFDKDLPVYSYMDCGTILEKVGVPNSVYAAYPDYHLTEYTVHDGDAMYSGWGVVGVML